MVNFYHCFSDIIDIIVMYNCFYYKYSLLLSIFIVSHRFLTLWPLAAFAKAATTMDRVDLWHARAAQLDKPHDNRPPPDINRSAIWRVAMPVAGAVHRSAAVRQHVGRP